ncbi:DUF2637 domain-containing protein [Streptomyces sp. 061-3]|uniref:DUF2637 domain-containing protein n=1 Tax=Streptomyces sp. 061-3 TaxID=2789268 RepID=UPI003980032C
MRPSRCRVAAYASYVHQRGFALQGGADEVSASLWPLSVDGLLLLATVGLLKPSGARTRVGVSRMQVRGEVTADGGGQGPVRAIGRRCPTASYRASSGVAGAVSAPVMQPISASAVVRERTLRHSLPLLEAQGRV